MEPIKKNILNPLIINNEEKEAIKKIKNIWQKICRNRKKALILQRKNGTEADKRGRRREK